MTSRRRPSSRPTTPSAATDPAAAPDAAGAVEEYEDAADYDEDAEWEYEDADEVEAAEEPRGWPLGTLLAITLGIWAGRWFYRLPDGLEAVAGLLLVLLTAIFAAALYRRWVRRQFAQARARRRR